MVCIPIRVGPGYPEFRPSSQRLDDTRVPFWPVDPLEEKKMFIFHNQIMRRDPKVTGEGGRALIMVFGEK